MGMQVWRGRGGKKEDEEEREERGEGWRKTASACQERGQSSEVVTGAALRSKRKDRRHELRIWKLTLDICGVN